MKRGLLIGTLTTAAVCVLFHIFKASSAEIFSTAMAFPFEQIGLGLRILSLSGPAGNAIGVAFYAMICLLPTVPLLIRLKRRTLRAEDGLLALLSITLFAVLYIMINPGFLGGFTRGAAGLSVGRALLGGTVYAILCGYIVLRLLRLFFSAAADRLMEYICVMLALLGILFVCVIFGVCIGNFLDSIEALRAGNAGSEHLLGTTYFFLGLQYIATALPYAMSLMIVFAALQLLEKMLVDRYSAEAVTAAGRLSRLCTVALTVTVLAGICFNVLQLIFAKSLMVINSSLEIPVFSIAFVLGVLLLTRFVTENKELKDDNDLFI